ncbi:MAG: hypothetical protein WA126_14410 [Thermodesulfovibrionales bacterium]
MSIQIKRVLKVISILLVIFTVCILVLAYLRYRDLKNSLITKIADEATSFIGQKVEIRDLFIGPASDIILHDISVKNPVESVSGELLRIRKLHLKMKYAGLPAGRLDFQNITVYSPELTILRDKEGRMNISEKLMDFFKRKSTVSYRVDELTIESGIFDFNKDKKYRCDNVNVHLKNLSSDSGTKTEIKGSASYAAGRIGIDGWAYLKDKSKKMKISVFSDGVSLSAFRDILDKYKINTVQTKIAMDLTAEGDIETGVNFRSKFQINNAGLYPFRNEIKNIIFSADAFLNMREWSIFLKDISLEADGILGLRADALIKDLIKNPVFSSELKINRIDLSALRIREDLALSGVMTSDTIDIKGMSKEMLPEISGTIFIKSAALKKDSKKNIFKDANFNCIFKSKGGDLGFTLRSVMGKMSTGAAGTIKKIMQKDRIAEIKINQPEVKVADIRETFWEIFPDSLLYAGLDGAISSEALISFAPGILKVNGTLRIREFILQGENGEYSIGPVNGAMPIVYSKTNDEKKVLKLPSFDRSEFDDQIKYYSQKTFGNDYSRITIGSLNYGFKFLDNINIWIKQEGSLLNIGRFSGNIFGGRLNGSAVVDVSDELNYRAGILLEGLSLTKLCDGIEPIKGYISGKVDGIASLKGKGTGISQLIGKADFWTYSTKEEKTKISREFLQRVGGPSLGAYLRDRNFDKGIMSLYLQNGFIIFKELEMSNRNLLGITDLSVKVAPLSNRIAIDHLMWSITEAAQRAQKKN